ncbi:MAG: hypothetical protein M1833_007302 [Piccolia ochrophora]|nr:MAG: hypothetical protein M1833_007302 [Piccolia ochrophora]
MADSVIVLELMSQALSIGSRLRKIDNAPGDLRALADELGSLAEVLRLLEEEKAIEGNVEAIYERSLRECSGTLEEIGRLMDRSQSRSKASKFFSFDPNFQNVRQLVGRLERQKSILQITLSSNANLNTSQLIQATKQYNALKQSEQRDYVRQKYFDWISSFDSEAPHLDLRAKRHSETGGWLLETQGFKWWFNTYKETLILEGLGGNGKSVLMSQVVDYIEGARVTIPSTGVAYFYCRYQDRRTQSPLRFLRIILRQMALQLDEVPESLERLYQDFGYRGKSPSYDEVFSATSDVVQQFQRIFLCVDASDEWEDTTRFELFSVLKQLNQEGVNILVTSRPQIKLVGSILSDTRLSVRASEQEKIINSILHQADGMILWATLQLNRSLKQLTVKKMREALNTLPKSLASIYDNTLDRILLQDEERVFIARTVLSLVLRATRPLSIVELQEGLAVVEGEQTISDDVLTEVSVIIESCCGFITMDESATVRLAHLSVHQFLHSRHSTLDG